MEYKLKSGKILEVREAEESDADNLVAFAELSSGESDYLSFGPGEFNVSAEEEVEILKTYKEDKGKIFLVGFIDGEVVGSLGFTNGKRNRMQHFGEFGMTVRKENWGDGIGTILVDCLIDWAKGSNLISKINLMVRHDNVRGINLYLKQGFSFEGKIPRGIKVKGEYFDVYTMGLCI
ncbi:MAG: GNAT family N-acetyltransferase [Allomuricauda sp.]